MTLFVMFFQHLAILGPPNTAKQGKRQNDKSTLLYPPTKGTKLGIANRLALSQTSTNVGRCKLQRQTQSPSSEKSHSTSRNWLPISIAFKKLQGLSDPTGIPPLSRDRCLRIPLSPLCFHVVSQTIAATPPLLSLKMAWSQSKDRPNKGIYAGLSLPLTAYRAIGGVARNSITNLSLGVDKTTKCKDFGREKLSRLENRCRTLCWMKSRHCGALQLINSRGISALA